jgi:hypothetical protein
MEHILNCHQCGNSFLGQWEKYCSTGCKNIVQAQVDAWTYSGAWLNDLSALTGAIATQQGQHLTEIPTK